MRKQIRKQVSQMIAQSTFINNLSRHLLVFIAEVLVLRAIRAFVRTRKTLILQSREKLNFLFASAKLMAQKISRSELSQEERNLTQVNM